MSNVKAIISNTICTPLTKSLNGGMSAKIIEKNENTELINQQKIYAKDLSSLGFSIKKNFTSQNKARLDELAKEYIDRFFTFLENQTPQKSTQCVLNALNKENCKFVEALSIDVRNFETKMESLKKIVGRENYENKIIPAFYSSYQKYLGKLWTNENTSVDYLYALRPDWSFRKLMTKMDFTKTKTFGELPRDFISEKESEVLFDYLCKNTNDKNTKTSLIDINNDTFKISNLTNGQAKAGVFLVEKNEQKYVIKVTNKATYDDELRDLPNIKTVPSRNILADYYLSQNNCKDIARLYYYKYNPAIKKDISIYEYIDGEPLDLKLTGIVLPDMRNLKLLFRDTTGFANVIKKDGHPYCVDTDNSLNTFPWLMQNRNFTYTFDFLSFHL